MKIEDKVQPDRVMVELCDERRSLMYSSPSTVQKVTWEEVRQVIKQKGLGQAMLLLPLLFASSVRSKNFQFFFKFFQGRFKSIAFNAWGRISRGQATL